MISRILVSLVSIGSLLVSGVLWAHGMQGGSSGMCCDACPMMHVAAAPEAAGQMVPSGERTATYSGVGTVKRIDAAKGTLTLQHEPIKALNWPAMTMDFKARGQTLLKDVTSGDRVSFEFVQSGSDYVITRVDKAPSAK